MGATGGLPEQQEKRTLLIKALTGTSSSCCTYQFHF